MQIRMALNPTFEKMSDEQLRPIIEAVQRSKEKHVKGEAIGVATKESEDARVTFVHRYVTKITELFTVRSRIEKELTEARNYCDDILKAEPDNNFFNFARAALDTNPEEQKKYLQKAATSVEPYGKDISAQAAFQLAKLFYASAPSEMMRYIYIEAWYVRALILGDEVASKQFCQLGLYQDTEKDYKELTLNNCQPLFTSFLAVILSGAKIKDFETSRLLTEKFEVKGILDPDSVVRNAHALKNPLAALQEPRSDVRITANNVIARGKADYFLNFFRYCYDSQIVPKEVYSSVLEYLANHDMVIKQEVLEQVASEQVRLTTPAVQKPQQVVDLLGAVLPSDPSIISLLPGSSVDSLTTLSGLWSQPAQSSAQPQNNSAAEPGYSYFLT